MGVTWAKRNLWGGTGGERCVGHLHDIWGASKPGGEGLRQLEISCGYDRIAIAVLPEGIVIVMGRTTSQARGFSFVGGTRTPKSRGTVLESEMAQLWGALGEGTEAEPAQKPTSFIARPKRFPP